MKKTLIALGLLCSLASCKKSDQKPSAAVSITGKWYHTKTVLNESIGGVSNPTETTNFSDPKPYVIFNSDGTGSSVEVAGNNSTTTNFTYTISDEKIILNYNSDTETEVINSLTTTSLQLHSDNTYVTTGGTFHDVVDDYFTR